MSLWNGVDLVSIATEGVYSEGYISSTGGGNIANLMASFGLLEDAPNVDIIADVADTFFKLIRGGAKLFTEGARIFLRR